MHFSYNPKDDHYTFYHYEHYSDGTLAVPDKIPFGTFILYFISLNIDEISNAFIENLHERREEYIHTINGYDIALSMLSKKYDKRVITLILDQVFNICFDKHIALSSVLDSMRDSLLSLHNDIIDYVLTGTIEKDGWIEILPNSQKILVSFRTYTDCNEIYMDYEIKDIFSLISLDFVNIQSKNIQIKQCENCKQYFIPAKRSDEIYCDRIYKNGKTCKELGYSEKVKDNAFMLAYTKARKTQHARIRYNSHIPDYKEKHYESWKKAAEQARDKFQAENDINGFEKWLNEHKNSF